MDLGGLPKKHFGALLVDPPWYWKAWSTYKELEDGSMTRATERHYPVMGTDALCALPVADVMQDDSALFMWIIWPMLEDALTLMRAWGYTYKSCAFSWIKGDARQMEMFQDDVESLSMGLGYWTRANSEVCLLGTRGSPKRLDAGVRQAIVEPRREHSRKPDCVYGRIERLVNGPYLELFARNQRPNWVSIGNETEKFPEVKPEVEVKTDNQVEMFS
jgi:N6-adenosine-specific RNA methylase IME4